MDPPSDDETTWNVGDMRRLVRPLLARDRMRHREAAVLIALAAGLLANACGSTTASSDAGASAGKGGHGSGGQGGIDNAQGGSGGNSGSGGEGGSGQDAGACRQKGQSCQQPEHCCGALICAGICTMPVNEGTGGNGGATGGAGGHGTGGVGGNQMYGCGSDTCTAGESYCYSYTPGTAGQTGRSCQPTPAACAATPTSCACLCPPASNTAFGCTPVGMGAGNFCTCSDTGGVVDLSCAGS